MFYAYSVIFTAFHKLRHICPHSGIFWQVQAYSESWHSQTYSCILRHILRPWLIQVYSEPWTHLAHFRHYSRSIYEYSMSYLRKLSYIQNSGLFRHVHAYLGIFRKLHIGTYLPTLRFTHIQDPGIVDSNNVKKHLLFKSGSSSNHCSDLFGTWFHFCFKSNYSTYLSSGQYFNYDNNNNNNSTPLTLSHHPPHPRKNTIQGTHAIHANLVSTPPASLTLARPHATHSSTSPT